VNVRVDPKLPTTIKLFRGTDDKVEYKREEVRTQVTPVRVLICLGNGFPVFVLYEGACGT
jgi:hypothetical protein